MRLLPVLLLTAALAFTVRAQPADFPGLGAEVGAVGLSDSARVSLLTMLPGDEVYSLWGHNAIRIADPASGIDRAYNYGTFDASQPHFVLRFLSGRLNYLLDTAPFDYELRRYAAQGRPIVEQTLDLRPETVRALYDLLETNALPQNRDYRYDFLRDNCSTRLLDVLDAALAETGRPVVALPPTDTASTFRDDVRRYMVGDPLVDVGTALGLGLPMDRVPTRREAVFLPLALAEALDGATVAGRPLVTERDTLFWIEGAGLPEPAFPWPAVVTWGLLVVGLAGAVFGSRLPTGLRRLGRLADALLFAAAGFAGTVLLLLWTATDHYVTEANVELLWLWPTHLAFAIPLLRVDLPPVWRRYALAAAVVAALSVVVWIAAPEPVHPATLPLALLVAVRAGDRSRGKA
ncbi:DUF4105 domain-containing protein [Rubrivirga marina]|uniref:Uncharacterized protein n=1 Tax=Rubrivirga marina TaxID=1196024 RepID=A0A271J439_9BACT|nr:DUF4105 domain-containing protein [Rubrivirga marina]PAP78048.1 hypothetical protein BSZ37_17185 [Rubrivirga marina]